MKHLNHQLSQIDGGSLPNRTSVYLHLEQGLSQSHNEPAIISMHEPSASLTQFIATVQQAEPPVEDRNNNHQQGTNIHTSKDVNGICDSRTITYNLLHRASQRLAAGITGQGVQPGSTLLSLLPNGAEYGLVLWTSTIARLTIVCEDPLALASYGPTAFKDLLRTLKPSVIAVADPDTATTVDTLVADLQLARPLRISTFQDAPNGNWTTFHELANTAAAQAVDLEQLTEAARNDDPDRVASISFTSGTSGRPKGGPLRVQSLTQGLHAQTWLVDRLAGRRALQQAHPSKAIALAQTLQTWKAGGAVVMSGNGFAADDILAAIRQHGATFVVLSPPLVHALELELRRQPCAVDCVRTIQVGGDAVTRGTMMKCAALFPRARVCVNHGMTEGGRAFAWPFFGMPIAEIPFFGQMCPVGAVAPGSIVRIWDAERLRPCKRGEAGGLHICSNSIIRHYLGGASEASFYEDATGRWFDTGDVAVMDSKGLVSILGRGKDAIKQNGVTIMPAPIECCIEEYTGTSVAVVSITKSGGINGPFAVVSDFGSRTPGEIKEHVEKILGKEYALAGIVSLRQIQLAEFPVNATHKIMKSEIQAAVIKALDSLSVQ